MDGMPFIGRYSAHHQDWLVATGFQKWGMTAAVTAARTLTALALDRELPDGADIFSPARFHAMASAGQLVRDAGRSIQGLGRQALDPGRTGARRDAAGRLHAVPLKCTHMGCRLTWNPEERTWDCPCHGSRFDCQGRLLDGPARKDLTET